MALPKLVHELPIVESMDVEIKNKILGHMDKEGMVNLEALVTPTQLEVFGFIDVANLYVLSISSFKL